MRRPVCVRELTAQEVEAMKRLVHSRTESARRVERVKIVCLSSYDQRVPAIAAELHLDAKTVRAWRKHFNAQGLPGLEDAVRSRRLTTYTAKEAGEVVAALTNPQSLGL